MDIINNITWLKIQILETEKIADMVKDHPLMAENWLRRVRQLKGQLKKTNANSR